MTTFTYATVLSTLEEGAVRRISLNRPERLNAMNRQLIDDVARAFDDANADPATRAIVFTGEGRAFCAGDDRQDHVHPESEAAARDLVEAIQRASRAISFGPKPVVGAISGWAVGGGFEWAINCDFPVWAESARGFFPEVSLNLFVTGCGDRAAPADGGTGQGARDACSSAAATARRTVWSKASLAGRALDAPDERGACRRVASLPPAGPVGAGDEAHAQCHRRLRHASRARAGDRCHRRRLSGSGNHQASQGILNSQARQGGR